MPDPIRNLDEAIDAVEAAYEFMLAYAAQGRRRDDDDSGSGIRERLTRAAEALDIIAGGGLDWTAVVAGAGAGGADFLKQAQLDAGRARAAIGFVLSRPTIGSQIIDNLNATSHMRTLLTDLFLLDEALKISGV